MWRDKPSRFLRRLAAFHAMAKARCCPPGERACPDCVESEGAMFCRLGGDCYKSAQTKVEEVMPPN